MPDPAADDDLIHRYQTIEQAYCESRWREVLREGEKLLDELARGEGGETEGLTERLQLLLGHTHLYGFADRDAAEDHYSAVLRSRADTSLRQIASEGLARCNQPRGSSGDPATETLNEPEPSTPEPIASTKALVPEFEAQELDVPELAVPEPFESPLMEAPALTLAKQDPNPLLDAAGAMAATPWQSDVGGGAAPPQTASPFQGASPTAATPWLQAAGGAVAGAATTTAAAAELPRLVPEVLEEPEQIEVYQSTPELADEQVLEPVIEPLSEPAIAAFQDELVVDEGMDEGMDEVITLAADPEAAEEPLDAMELTLPEPAADEDPELVQGLLRVLIR